MPLEPDQYRHPCSSRPTANAPLQLATVATADPASSIAAGPPAGSRRQAGEVHVPAPAILLVVSDAWVDLSLGHAGQGLRGLRHHRQVVRYQFDVFQR